ncbi:MAG: hypothetical protein CSA07_00170 [Bacteroidia bacterium]|nr:MAG: hypothetical protein CSA07_00170 [Bacteroidia bacterium]
MFVKKIAIVLLLVVACLGLAVLLAPKLRMAAVEDDVALRVMPRENIALLLRVNDWQDLQGQLAASESLWQEFSSGGWAERMQNVVCMVDSLVSRGTQLGQAVERGELYVSYHRVDRGGWQLAPLLTFSPGGTPVSLSDLAEVLFPGQTGEPSKGNLSYTTYSYALKEGNLPVHVAARGGVLLLSSDHLLLEQALRQPTEQGTLVDSPDFMDILSAASRSESLNLFVNLPYVLGMAEGSFREPWRTTLRALAKASNPWCGWCAIDLTASGRVLAVNGLSRLHDSIPQTSNRLLGVSTQPVEIAESIPARVPFFIRWGATEPAHLSGLIGGSEGKGDEQLGKLGAQELALAFMPREEAWVLLLGGEEIAQGVRYLREKSKPVGAQREVYQFSEPDFFRQLSDVFPAGLARHYTVVGPSIAFSADVAALRGVREAVEGGLVMAKSSRWGQLRKEMQTDCNLMVYTNLRAFRQWMPGLLSDSSLARLEQGEPFKQLIGGVLQVSAASNIAFYSAFVAKGSAEAVPSETEWESKLDAPLAAGPWVLPTHRKERKVILAVDTARALYMLNPRGVRRWKRQLSGPVLGAPLTVDLFRNGYIQYLFTMPDEVLAIDYNGNPVRSRMHLRPGVVSTAPMVGFAYPEVEGPEGQRYLLMGADRQLRMYDAEGSQKTGFDPPRLETETRRRPIWMQHAFKDYIVVADSLRTYLLQRNGKERWQPEVQEPVWSHSEIGLEGRQPGNVRLVDSLLYVSGKQELVTVDLATHAVTTVPMKALTDAVRVLFADLNSDRNLDLLVVKRRSVAAVSQSGKVLWVKDFSTEISPDVQLYTGPLRVGVVELGKPLVHLLDRGGQESRGFPRVGSSPVSLGWGSASTCAVGLPGDYIVGYDAQ